MSLRAYEAVWEHDGDAKGGALLVLLAIADHSDRDTGVSWPSPGTLSQMTRLERRQVGRILVALEEDGMIDRWHYRDGSRWANLYRITVGPFAHLDGVPPLERCIPGPPPTARSTRQNVAPADATIPTRQSDISATVGATFSAPCTSSLELELVLEPLMDFWLAQDPLISHRKSYFDDPKMRRLAARATAKYGTADVRTAISNYAAVLASPDHYWTMSWGFAEFLSRGLDRFVPEADPLSNFRTRKTTAPPEEFDDLDRI